MIIEKDRRCPKSMMPREFSAIPLRQGLRQSSGIALYDNIQVKIRPAQ